jgi:hypothetical protein
MQQQRQATDPFAWQAPLQPLHVNAPRPTSSDLSERDRAELLEPPMLPELLSLGVEETIDLLAAALLPHGGEQLQPAPRLNTAATDHDVAACHLLGNILEDLSTDDLFSLMHQGPSPHHFLASPQHQFQQEHSSYASLHSFPVMRRPTTEEVLSVFVPSSPGDPQHCEPYPHFSLHRHHPHQQLQQGPDPFGRWTQSVPQLLDLIPPAPVSRPAEASGPSNAASKRRAASAPASNHGRGRSRQEPSDDEEDGEEDPSEEEEEEEEEEDSEDERKRKRPLARSRGRGPPIPIPAFAPARAAPTQGRTSSYRGVTKHRRSGRWESHIWVKEQNKQVSGDGGAWGGEERGLFARAAPHDGLPRFCSLLLQVYLGGYEQEDHAAEAYDVACLKLKGPGARINFGLSNYSDVLATIADLPLEE